MDVELFQEELLDWNNMKSEGKVQKHFWVIINSGLLPAFRLRTNAQVVGKVVEGKFTLSIKLGYLEVPKVIFDIVPPKIHLIIL